MTLIKRSNLLKPKKQRCFWCGSNLVSFDASYYDPCETCLSYFNSGIVIMGYTKDSPCKYSDQPCVDISNVGSVYLTGTYAVVQSDRLKEIVSDKSILAQSLWTGQCVTEESMLQEYLHNASSPDQQVPL